jgi:hypothetical protein
MTTTDRTTKQLYHFDLETHTSVELGPTLRIYLAVRHLPPLSLHKGLVQLLLLRTRRIASAACA